MDRSLSRFRYWLNEKWYEHQEECAQWHSESNFSDAKTYFKTYKWWLKREYRHQQRTELERLERIKNYRY